MCSRMRKREENATPKRWTRMDMINSMHSISIWSKVVIFFHSSSVDKKQIAEIQCSLSLVSIQNENCKYVLYIEYKLYMTLTHFHKYNLLCSISMNQKFNKKLYHPVRMLDVHGRDTTYYLWKRVFLQHVTILVSSYSPVQELHSWPVGFNSAIRCLKGECYTKTSEAVVWGVRRR